MATRKSTTPPPPAQALLTVDQMKRGITRLQALVEQVQAFDETKVVKRWGADQTALELKIESVLTSIFGVDTLEYKRFQGAKELDRGPTFMSFGQRSPHDIAQEAQENVRNGKVDSVAILSSAIDWLEDEIKEAQFAQGLRQESAPMSAPGRRSSKPRKVFIVHGHDAGAKEAVARFFEKLEFSAVILSEQANSGRTIIEKIEAINDVSFAVVLLTPDDVGSKAGQATQPRARQNVILELGYFMGKLGRPNVCALVVGDLELPSDISGVVWTRFDPETNGWKQALAQELQTVGFEIDWNAFMGRS